MKKLLITIMISMTTIFVYAEETKDDTELLFDTLFLGEKASMQMFLYSVLAFDETWGSQLASFRDALSQDEDYNNLQFQYEQCVWEIIRNNENVTLENKDKMVKADCDDELTQIYNYVKDKSDSLLE